MEKINLTGVPETMLQTIYARAKESRTRGAVHDGMAEKIIDRLDYDFSLADNDRAMHDGVIARTIVLDRMTKSWLDKNPGAVIVNIACGLDTRCYRVKEFSHWYNIDLPETIAVRERMMHPADSTWLLKNSPKLRIYILHLPASTTVQSALIVSSPSDACSTAVTMSESLPTPEGSMRMRSGA